LCMMKKRIVEIVLHKHKLMFSIICICLKKISLKNIFFVEILYP